MVGISFPCNYSCLSEDLLDELLVVFQHLLLGPGLAELLCHLVAFICGKLGLMGSLLQVFINHLLPSAYLILTAHLPTSLKLAYLAI